MNENIDKFLDAVDLVLNSNTLLLVFPPLSNNSPEKYLSEILSSGDFEQEFLRQDRERGWNSYHRIDQNAQWIPRDTTEKLVRRTDPVLTACTFTELKSVLLAMLTLQSLPHRSFNAPYGNEMSPKEAEPIVQDFLEAIDVNETDSRIYEIEPVFLYTHDKERQSERVRGYFYNLGSDCSFAFCAKNKLYILLVNGSD